jgi:DNA polymerase-3 subunit delta
MTKAKQEIQQVYFLYGPESYLIEEEVQRLLDQTLTPKERGLNLHAFDGEEHSGQEISQAAQTLPMFSKYRFVLVNEADRMEEENVEALLRYILDPSPTTCLVMVGQSAGSWKRHQAAVEKVGKAVEYGRLKGRGLASWIKKRMGEKGKTISEEAVDYLMEVVGDHLQDHENALEKISLSVKEKRSIALSDIEGIVSEVKISTVFDLTEAIGQQNLEKALGILEKALESKAIPFRKDEETSKKMEDPIPLLLSMMARQYRLIWRVKELLTHHQGSGEVAKVLRMSPWNVKKLMDQGRKFSVSFLREAILRCHQTDMAVKRGRGPKNLLMEKLVIDLCRPV